MKRDTYEATLASWQALGLGEVRESRSKFYMTGEVVLVGTVAEGPALAAQAAAVAIAAGGSSYLNVNGQAVHAVAFVSRDLDAEDGEQADEGFKHYFGGAAAGQAAS